MMNKKLKFFWNGYFDSEISSFGMCRKKGDILASIRTKQIQEYKKINIRQIEKRKELSL